MTDLTKYNAYIGVVASTETEARQIAQNLMLSDDPLVHTEPPTEEGELPTFVFAIYNEVQADFDDWDHLHDHYTLPNLPNYPYEAI